MTVTDTRMPKTGALVISLDFELSWGVRDRHQAVNGYTQNLLGARAAVPRVLDLFTEFEVASTWAVVGLLFARSREQLLALTPKLRPHYKDARLDPYQEAVGESEADDPLHFAPSLIERIISTPGQEIATHTFSHYYCLEEGQSKEAFEADLLNAIGVAESYGLNIKSIVFPRNQHNSEYTDVLLRNGIMCYRGNQRHRMYSAAATDQVTRRQRFGRLIDSYLPLSGSNATAWSDIVEPSGLCNVPSSRFLRPYQRRLAGIDPLRRRRIEASMEVAAKTNQVFHLWWHPHNFGSELEENLGFLRSILNHYLKLRDGYGMRSLTMAEAAQIARSLDRRDTDATG